MGNGLPVWIRGNGNGNTSHIRVSPPCEPKNKNNEQDQDPRCTMQMPEECRVHLLKSRM
jgi:hypothetical protein